MRSPYYPYTKGDLRPLLKYEFDIRNDHAGTEMDQLRMAIMRYLRNRLDDTTITLSEMYEDLTRRDPFHGTSFDTFRDAVSTLVEKDWALMLDGGFLVPRKVARVAERWLQHRNR